MSPRVDERITEEPEPREPSSNAEALVLLALELYDFGISTDGQTFAVERQRPTIALPLAGKRSALRAELAARHYDERGRPAPASALNDALLVLDGMARRADPVRVHLRVARHHDRIYLDLGDESGDVIEIRPGRWRRRRRSPVLFWRNALTAPLPDPESGS